MFKFIVLVTLFMFGACSTKGPSREVKTFVQSYEDQFNPKDPRYAEVYERYLASVEKLYKESDKKNEFRSYLDSLNNNSQILADQKHALPELFKKETGQTINDSTKQPYLMFRNRQMTSLSDKLYTARELKIKDEGGEELYQKLRVNYAKFIEKEKAEKFGFPL